jgi:predicted metal-dependent peptidase
MSKTNNTSSDLYIKRNVDPIRLANFDISVYLTKLLWIEPFYSRLLRSMNKIETKDIPTAGVSTNLDSINLYYNREFMASLSDKQVIGVLKHECLHILYEHTTKRIKDERLIWNYATDLAINSLLHEDELPKGGLIPGKHLPPLTKEESDKMNTDQLDRYNKLSSFIKSLPKEKSSEWYYEKFMDNEEVKELLKDKTINVQLAGDGTIDDHGDWGQLTPEESEMVQQKIKELIKDAQHECEKSKSWGSIHASIINDINILLSKDVPWNELLKRFIGFSTRNERISSITRLNRKYPGIHSGIQKNYKPKIAVYIDESGSVDDSLLSKFFGEINSLSSLCDFTLYKFDTEVDDANKIEFKKGKKYDLKRQNVGGTNFDAPTIHANERRKLYDGLVIMTDGCAPQPPFSRLRRCWILPKNTKLHFDYDKDIVINIK